METKNSTNGESYVYLMEGDSMFIDEEYHKAIEWYNEGLLHIAKKPNDPNHNTKIRFLLYSHLCSSYLKIGQFQKARDYGNRAMEINMSSMTTGTDRATDIDEKCILALKRKLEETATSSDTQTQQQEYQQQQTVQEQMRELVVEEIDTPKPKPKPKPPQAPTTCKPPSLTSTKRVKKSLPTVPKYQYYQNDSFMTISILEPSVDPSSLSVQFFPKKLIVRLTKEGHTFTVIYGTLFETVVVEKCKIKFMDEKVLIKLKKKEKLDWHELFGVNTEEEDQKQTNEQTKSSLYSAANNDGTVQDARTSSMETTASSSSSSSSSNTTSATTTTTTTTTSDNNSNNNNNKPSPYASKKDWNAIERDLKKQEATETPEGEEALNKLFRDIYGRSNPDTRRAMIKSFQTSGGTVLSTNWKEVKDADYEKDRQAPNGMEWKNWEGDRLKQKE